MNAPASTKLNLATKVKPQPGKFPMKFRLTMTRLQNAVMILLIFNCFFANLRLRKLKVAIPLNMI
ncbi:hypothetical protein LEP1GSC060_1952 [Leptospira weilii serovar Ranarum str. ICFT]|uniref:Uncharacterized protein n=1 Tax=Leptospira weilii serovar Ranarum str. ICFT TaxID=1218598 RepID=N1WHA1_9LEPT|nr:hypothetical protein LEP1GSC060_1952 [Leptospira weilii serovar Ranarum str. ICFT]